MKRPPLSLLVWGGIVLFVGAIPPRDSIADYIAIGVGLACVLIYLALLLVVLRSRWRYYRGRQ